MGISWVYIPTLPYNGIVGVRRFRLPSELWDLIQTVPRLHTSQPSDAECISRLSRIHMPAAPGPLPLSAPPSPGYYYHRQCENGLNIALRRTMPPSLPSVSYVLLGTVDLALQISSLPSRTQSEK